MAWWKKEGNADYVCLAFLSTELLLHSRVQVWLARWLRVSSVGVCTPVNYFHASTGKRGCTGFLLFARGFRSIRTHTPMLHKHHQHHHQRQRYQHQHHHQRQRQRCRCHHDQHNHHSSPTPFHPPPKVQEAAYLTRRHRSREGHLVHPGVPRQRGSRRRALSRENVQCTGRQPSRLCKCGHADARERGELGRFSAISKRRRVCSRACARDGRRGGGRWQTGLDAHHQHQSLNVGCMMAIYILVYVCSTEQLSGWLFVVGGGGVAAGEAPTT